MSCWLEYNIFVRCTYFDLFKKLKWCIKLTRFILVSYPSIHIKCILKLSFPSFQENFQGGVILGHNIRLLDWNYEPLFYKYSACYSSHDEVFANLLNMLHNYTQNFEIYLNKKKINQNISEKFGHPYIISDESHGNLKKYSGKSEKNQGAFFLVFCSHPV